MREITLTFTEYELKTLLQCADNGFGDRSFYIDDDGSPTGQGDGRKSIDAYKAARDKCMKALYKL